MAVVVTLTTCIKDWKALRQLSQENLLGQAHQLGATRYRVFRNIKDAAQVMIVVELPDYDTAQELVHAFEAQILSLLINDEANPQLWEPLGWEEIG